MEIQVGDWVKWADGIRYRFGEVEELDSQSVIVKDYGWAIDRNDIIEVRPVEGPR